MDIKWETPPSPTRGQNAEITEQEVFIANELAKNPGNWARLRDFEKENAKSARALAQLIRQGKRSAFKVSDLSDGTYDAVSRRVPGTDLTAVYVRYVTKS
jgi:hypothetical protein